MPYERPLGSRHTFRIKTEIAKTQPNQFFHILQTGRTPSRHNNTYIKWVAVYSDSEASSLCLASKPALGGRPPSCGASRFIVPSRACTNSALPRGRPVWVHRRISVSLDSISPAARYCRQALAVQLFRHRSKSKASFRDSTPQCVLASDDRGCGTGDVGRGCGGMWHRRNNL
jgi:hypothetical protein